MARGKKSGPSRLDLRRQNEAAEAQEAEDEAEDEDEDEDEEAAEEGEEADADAEGGDEDGGDDEDAPKPKKKAAAKKKAPAKKPAAKRSRVKEPPRMRAIWVIFDNGSKRVKEFPYAQKADAERVLAEKQEEKKGTFYLQLVKEPMES